MVNNSTNINKTNNLQFTPILVNVKETMTYITLEIQVLVWDRHRSVAVLNQLMGKQPQSLLIIKHPTPNTDIKGGICPPPQETGD